MVSTEISTIACDYDGTLAVDGKVSKSTIEQLQRAKSSGFNLLLVTGRQLGELLYLFPQPELFLRIVAENGAIVFDPKTKRTEVLGQGPEDQFLSQLELHGVPNVSVGRVVVAAPSESADTIRTVIRELKIPYSIILNKDSAMVLPTGIDKGTGLQKALKELGLFQKSVAAIGDAENDIHLFRDCGIRVAVANALPGLKGVADIVTNRPAGDGVTDFIGDLVNQKSMYSLP